MHIFNNWTNLDSHQQYEYQIAYTLIYITCHQSFKFCQSYKWKKKSQSTIDLVCISLTTTGIKSIFICLLFLFNFSFMDYLFACAFCSFSVEGCLFLIFKGRNSLLLICFSRLPFVFNFSLFSFYSLNRNFYSYVIIKSNISVVQWP